jgi:hypothetical protein
MIVDVPRAPNLPLWSRWLLTVIAFAVLIVAIGILARSGGSSSREVPPSTEVEANREGAAVISVDQAPHSMPLGSSAPENVALERAIAGDVRKRVAHQQLTGPFQDVSCSPSGHPVAGRRPFACTVISAGISYPFVGVVDTRAQTLTWCKRDPPLAGNAPLDVPVSARCRV